MELVNLKLTLWCNMEFNIIMDGAFERALAVLKLESIEPTPNLKRIESMSREVWTAGQFILKIGTGRNKESLEREASLMGTLPQELFIPQIQKKGSDAEMSWLFLDKIAGEKLSTVWPSLSASNRRKCVRTISNTLKTIHSCEPRLFLNYPENEIGYIELEKVEQNFEIFSGMDGIDSGVAKEVEMLVREFRETLQSIDHCPIHGDLHFANILCAEEKISAVLDFEYSSLAPPDLDLDSILRFCEYPDLYDPSAGDRSEYGKVPYWMNEDYELLFSTPNISKRMLFYNINFNISMIVNHPDVPIADSIFYNDLGKNLNGTGYLSKWKRLFIN